MAPPRQDAARDDARWLRRQAAVAACGAVVILFISVAVPGARAWSVWSWPLLFAVEHLGFLARIHARRRSGEAIPGLLSVPAATFAALAILSAISALLDRWL